MTRKKPTTGSIVFCFFGCCQSETTSWTCDVGQTVINAQYETHITGQKQVRHETQHSMVQFLKGFSCETWTGTSEGITIDRADPSLTERCKSVDDTVSRARITSTAFSTAHRYSTFLNPQPLQSSKICRPEAEQSATLVL